MPVKVRLTRKFAQVIDDIDLSNAQAGEELVLSERDAEVLIAEGWAAPVERADDKSLRGAHGKRKSGARRKRKNRQRLEPTK
jgi:hypothetical protein